MVKIYLVRHGETEDNRNHQLCGWSNPPLNEKGRQQAQKLALFLKNQSFDAIYTSGLKRTDETAKLITQVKEGSISFMEELRELHFGDFEGDTMINMEKKHPKLYQQMRDDFIGFRFPNGESLSDMHHRVTTAIEELIAKHKDEEILLVVHSGVIRSIIAQLITGDIKKHWNFKIEHCSVSIIEAYEDFNLLSKLNETSFLL